MNTIPTKSKKPLFIGVATIIALLAGCMTPRPQPSNLTAKKECVGLTQDGVITMLVERGDDGCEVDLSETLFFTDNPTCNENDPHHKPFKVKNIKTRGADDPQCIPIEGMCNDCVKWTIGTSPETVEYETSAGEYLTICYDIHNGSPLGCDGTPSNPCSTYFCMESVATGNCTDNRYDCVPDQLIPLKASGATCSAHEECVSGGSGMCLWPGESPRRCQLPEPPGGGGQ